MINQDFRKEVEVVIAKVPAGRVTTYGDVASFCGRPRAARIVGGIAHYGDPGLPWHRLVNRFGGLASGYHGGRQEQDRLLEQDGVVSTDYVVDNFEDLRWKPENL